MNPQLRLFNAVWYRIYGGTPARVNDFQSPPLWDGGLTPPVGSCTRRVSSESYSERKPGPTDCE